MEDMKGDMSGGAAVIEGIGAIADLGLPLRVIGVVGATENAIGGGAFRPGDILTARTARRSRSRTPTRRAGWSSPTCSGTRASRAQPTSSTSRP